MTDDLPDFSSIIPVRHEHSANELPARCCGRCMHGHVPDFPAGVSVDFSVRECHALPPHVQFFMVPAQGRPPMARGPQQVQFNIMEHSGWPKVQSHRSCGMFMQAGSSRPD